MFEIVIDTNVIVAAFRSKRGAAALLLEKLNDNRISINVSTALLLEYEEVLTRPEMFGYVSPKEATEFIDALCSIANLRKIHFLWRSFVLDPDDAFLLELAIKSSADFIITFNKRDFPGAADFGIELKTPRELLRTLGEL